VRARRPASPNAARLLPLIPFPLSSSALRAAQRTVQTVKAVHLADARPAACEVKPCRSETSHPLELVELGRKIRPARVFRGDFDGSDRPVDPDRGIVPSHAAFLFRRVEGAHHVERFRIVGQGEDGVGEAA
jgi:hypothetical protein